MKKLIIAALVAGFAITPVFAGDDLEGHCVAFNEETGGDASGCSCLADEADASMTEELLAVASEADLEGLSQGTKDAIGVCWPDAA